jgi:hypothetical protein
VPMAHLAQITPEPISFPQWTALVHHQPRRQADLR